MSTLPDPEASPVTKWSGYVKALYARRGEPPLGAVGTVYTDRLEQAAREKLKGREGTWYVPFWECRALSGARRSPVDHRDLVQMRTSTYTAAPVHALRTRRTSLSSEDGKSSRG